MDIFDKIDELLNLKEKVIVTIDGCCASGKTTLAKKLKDKYNCEIIRMDDLFLPKEKRTSERLATPGGNIDYPKARPGSGRRELCFSSIPRALVKGY